MSNAFRNKKKIAFWGCPKPEIINKYQGYDFIDLDIDYGYKDLKFIPDNYCTIIKNIYNNALQLKDEIALILAPTGKDKCDSAYFIAKLLKDKGFKVLELINEDVCPDIKNLKLPISKSNLPLKEKINLITKNIYEKKDYSNLKESTPSFGFWGVPPNDLNVLDIFPDNTHVFGWCRAVEANYPGDWQLESYVDENLPTVFFTQSFCSKTVVAKYLANKYQGLLIDIDTIPTNSVYAKIEAFIKLR